MATISDLTLRTTLSSMQIGDVISCEYTAISGTAGTFASLGGATKSLIPAGGSAAPDGSFYFIKVADGLLIADRVLQHSITYSGLSTTGKKYNNGQRVSLMDTDSVIPAMTSNTAPYGTASAGSVYSADNAAFKAFGRNTEFWITAASAPKSSWWLKYESATNHTVVSYSMTSPANGNNVYMPKSWKFEGSNDGTTWNELHAMSNEPNWGLGETRHYTCTTVGSYKQFRITVLSTQADGYAAISDLRLYSKVPVLTDTLLRLPSGGICWANASNEASLTKVSGIDKAFPVDNEWDRYVLGSTLGGKITAGDSGVWNTTTVSTICSDTPVIGAKDSDNTTGSSSLSVCRGNSTPHQLIYWNASSSATRGFRPVLEYIDVNVDVNLRPSTLWY